MLDLKPRWTVPRALLNAATLNRAQVMIAACDTFRSGAVEQLKTHCGRLGVPLYERGGWTFVATVYHVAVVLLLHHHLHAAEDAPLWLVDFTASVHCGTAVRRALSHHQPVWRARSLRPHHCAMTLSA